MKKIRCWEFKKCGREPGGKNAEKLGACPVALKTKLYGLKDDMDPGRFCWYIQGILCNRKLTDCLECEFYKVVIEEDFEVSIPKRGRSAE